MRCGVDFTDLYSGGVPELIEGDVFKTIIPLSNVLSKTNAPSSAAVTEKMTELVTELMAEKMTELEKDRLRIILRQIKGKGYITSTIAAELPEVKESTAKRLLRKALELELLQAEGSTKGRKYKLNSNQVD